MLYIILYKSMRRPVLATLFEKSKSIPVERPVDLAKNG